MPPRLSSAYIGEDVPVTITYEDPDTGDPVDPDDTDSSGDPNADVTISKEGTVLVDSAAMTYLSTGEFEYVWDTSVDEDGEGRYTVEASADFGGETKIERVTLRLE